MIIDPASDRSALEEISRNGHMSNVWLSHWHEDHIMHLDLFEELPIWMHEADAEPITNIDAFIDWYIYPDEAFEPMKAEWRQMLVEMFNYQPRSISRYLKDGELIDLGSVTAEVIHTPGHSPGSLSFFFREPQVLFLGDTDLTPFGPWYGDLVSDIDDIYRSVKRLREIPAAVWLTSHEQGIFESDPGSLWDDYLQVIEDREEKLLDFLSDPRTIKEIAGHWIVYGKPKKPVEMFFLIEEISMQKHLDRLITAGRVQKEGDRYRRV